jgi:hypothetical protein
MELCNYCSSLPLKLFSTARNKQCTIDHYSSFPALEESGAAGCELCKLFLHAVQKQTEDGEHDRVWGRWAADGKVTVSSTKFDGQQLQVNYRQAGTFRGRPVPADWRKAHPPKSWHTAAGAD